MPTDILESYREPPRLVAADLDGTLLLNSTHELSQMTIDAVRLLSEMGIAMVLVTGRMFRSAARFAHELALDGPLAAYQGAMIREVASGQLLHHDPVSLPLALEILEFVDGADCAVNVYLDDELFVERKNAYIERYERISGMQAHAVGRLSAFLDRPPTKIGVGGDPEVLTEILDGLCARFRGRANALKTWPFFLEMTNPSATKSNALALLGERMGFTPAQVLAFGDSYNDADMLSWAGIGVAMGDAPAEVAAMADRRCAPVDDDGFARYLAAQPWFPGQALRIDPKAPSSTPAYG
ncbi:MAG TPA: Cof-type HAD-IIB family hydrolase [Thermoleophilia bacterium]|nr:Cof-type HAD-IIB family hydrolase [Thermoleophilia bacterium]